MAGPLARQHPWIAGVAALAVWLAVGAPTLLGAMAALERGSPRAALWILAFAAFGAAALAATLPKLRPNVRWALLGVQVAAVVAMAALVEWAMMSVFLVITAWQAAMATTPARALGWVAFQMAAVTATLALVPNPDICWVLAKSFGLQLLLVFTAYALRWESESARALARTNRELRSAHAIIASSARDAERLRISRELHDAWGHELTALGLQLEIASHVAEPGGARDEVIAARGLARDLLGKVRHAVAALRETESCDLKAALEALAHSVPAPAIHVEIAADVQIGPDEALALVGCAQEAVTSAVNDAAAANLWLQVRPEGEGVRLVARNDGEAQPVAAAPGSTLPGLRERVERLGGRVAVRTGGGFGFALDAWLPLRRRHAA